MPIPADMLTRALVPQVLTPAATLAEALALLATRPVPQRAFVVVRAGAEAYDLLNLADLAALAGPGDAALLAQPLGAIPGLLRLAPPARQAAMGRERAEREAAARPRRRMVVLDPNGDVAGAVAPPSLAGDPPALPKESAIAALLRPATSTTDTLTGGPDDVPALPAQLLTRFDGVAPHAPLVVGRRTPLIVWVGAPGAGSPVHSSRPFAFDFAGQPAPVPFTVSVEADPAAWTIRAVEPAMIVAPPGLTVQEAEFVITPKLPGRDKLYLRVERDGAVVQHVWLPVSAASEVAASPPPAATQRIEVSLPLDAPPLARPAVELTIQPGAEGFTLLVHADLPGGQRRERYHVPAGAAALARASARLRAELRRIVGYEGVTGGTLPFQRSVTIDPQLARQTAVPLADAGQQVWALLFDAPRATAALGQLAEELRAVPHGTLVRVVLDTQELILPWALLYDRPGPITPATLDWSGFWGYRFVLDVLPPGRYPPPAIRDDAGLLLLLNDEQNLRSYTAAQEQLARQARAGLVAEACWGDAQVRQLLQAPPASALLYAYCHGTAAGGPAAPEALASESALFFSAHQGLRVADMRRLPAAPLASRPLVFLNACEGALQDPFVYDGFMPFFIEQQLARGFIGTEAPVPTRLAHDLGMQFLQRFAQGLPAGTILWQLRRHYLDQHHNILAMLYSLYGPGDAYLAWGD